MAKKQLTHTIAIIDRSGSMSSIQKDMEGGFNQYVKEQREFKDSDTLTLVQFDDQYEVVYEGQKLANVKEYTLAPRGMTALFDAIGKTIRSESERLSKLPKKDQPKKVVCVIVTDGCENSSKEFKTKDSIKKLVDAQKNWEFVYLGANQDAMLEGASYGFSQQSTMTYAAGGQGVANMFRSMSVNTVALKSGRVAGMAFSQQDRDAQGLGEKYDA